MGIFSGGGGGGTPSGAAGGDLSGTYPNPAVAALAITNAKVSATAAIAKTKLAGLDVVNADVNAAAAIAYSKLALGTSIVNADVNAAAAIALSKLADPTTGKVLGSVSNAAAAVFPPGYEIGYTQITAPVNITGTAEGTATTVLSPGALTFDGAPVIVEIFAPFIQTPTVVGQITRIAIFESTTVVSGQLGGTITYVAADNAIYGWYARYRFTPTAAAHTYTVQAWATSTTGTPQFGAGAGGTGAFAPAFIRFTKA